MERFARFVARRAGLVVLLAVALAVLGLAQIVDLRTGERRLQVDPSANRLLPEGDADSEFYEFVRRLFGSDETLLVALAADDVFTADKLERIARMTRRIGELAGVHHVVSLANALNVRGSPEGLDIGPFVGDGPLDPAEVPRIRQEVLANPIYAGNLVSRDGRATAMLVYFSVSDSEFLKLELDRQIRAIADAERGDAEIWITGTPFIKAETTRLLLGDLLRTPPLMVAVLGLVLAFSFRTVRGVLIPLASIAVGVVCMLGTLAALGYSLNVVTVLVPTLLATIGLSYCVYSVSEFEEDLRRAPGTAVVELVARSLRRVALPLSLAALTTAAGFTSLLVVAIGPIREFGLFSILGVIYTAVASVTVTPALLALCARPRRLAHAATEGPFERFVERVARFDTRQRVWIFAGAAVVFALSLLAAERIRVGTDHIANFAPDNPIRSGFEAVNAHLEGANPFYVVVQADYSDAFKEPANLRELEALQRWLATQPEIGGSTSLVDYLKLINRGFHENDPTYLAVPDSQRLASQLLFFGANDEIERFVDSRYQIANVMVRAKVIDSDEVSELIARIEARLAELPERFHARVTGNPVLINRAIDGIMRGQAQSVVLALVQIYLLLSVLLVNFRVGFLALLPNVLPVAAYFGALGLFGVSLNPGTSVIAPMVLGISVDDTIHYFARFSQEARRLANDREATVVTMKAVGRPAAYTSISLCLGFLVLTTSELKMSAQVGAMAAFALGFGIVCEFLLTPALCSGLRIATLWDALTLDLGPEPHRSIPLLSGLSKAQARIVALMSTLVDVPAGTRLIHAGERGQEMYVVIDGTLQASVPGEQGRIALTTHTRGDTFGEIGLFYATRTADVDAVTDSRLLRLTQASLDRLGWRYWRTAARVHRNLNEILANRVARLTARLR